MGVNRFWLSRAMRVQYEYIFFIVAQYSGVDAVDAISLERI